MAKRRSGEPELSEQTKRDIKKARKEITEGKYKTHEDVGIELGFRER